MATTQAARARPRTSSAGGMKAVQIGIWVSTGLFSAMFALSGAMFIAGPAEVVANFRHLGFPDYFRELLGIAKLLGVAALLLPLPYPTLREWAYAGFTFVCISASVSHLLSGDPIGKVVPPLFALALLLTSYFLRRRTARTERTGV
jgi:hypothetical protein